MAALALNCVILFVLSYRNTSSGDQRNHNSVVGKSSYDLFQGRQRLAAFARYGRRELPSRHINFFGTCRNQNQCILILYSTYDSIMPLVPLPIDQFKDNIYSWVYDEGLSNKEIAQRISVRPRQPCTARTIERRLRE
jgi:hypothetical protein